MDEYRSPAAGWTSSLALLEIVAGAGGSHALDLLGSEWDDAVVQARRLGLLSLQTGSWGDSDYLVLTTPGLDALAARGAGRAGDHMSRI